MYCVKCGKQTDNTEGLCDECKAKSEQEKDVFFDAPTIQPVEQPTTTTNTPMTKKYGFGKALASTILGAIGYVFGIFPSTFLSAYNMISETGELNAEELNQLSLILKGCSWAFFVMALPLGILSLIFGIKSIGKFKEAKAQGVKPIATLVLGIVGIVGGATTLLLCLISLAMLA